VSGDQHEPDTPVRVLIEIEAPPGLAQATKDRFVEVIRTAPKPGFIEATIYASRDEPNTFFSLQEWESEATFRSHMADSADGLEASRPLLAKPPRLTILEEL
jgi:quinol monooxygenase YgiN